MKKTDSNQLCLTTASVEDHSASFALSPRMACIRTHIMVRIAHRRVIHEQFPSSCFRRAINQFLLVRGKAPRALNSTFQQGFTLIELTVVLLIVVLGFSAIGISVSSGNQSAQLKAATRDLVSALRYARGQALISHQEVALAIDLSENSYQLSNRDKVYNFSDEIELTLIIAQDELLDEEIGHIRFFADGSSTGGRITMEWGSIVYRIDVNWLSGKIDISDE